MYVNVQCAHREMNVKLGTYFDQSLYMKRIFQFFSQPLHVFGASISYSFSCTYHRSFWTKFTDMGIKSEHFVRKTCILCTVLPKRDSVCVCVYEFVALKGGSTPLYTFGTWINTHIDDINIRDI